MRSYTTFKMSEVPCGGILYCTISATGDEDMLQRGNLYAHHVCEKVCSKNRVKFVVRNKGCEKLYNL